jgi:hypothetical protein
MKKMVSFMPEEIVMGSQMCPVVIEEKLQILGQVRPQSRPSIAL